MNLSDLLNGPIGQTIVKNVAGQFDLNKKQASAAVNVAIPVILGGLNKNVQTPDGAVSLNNALESKHDGSLLDNLGNVLGGGNLSDLLTDGGGILGHVFGNKVDVVESGIAKKAGISTDKMGAIIKMLAPVVMAYLGKEKATNNAKASDLGSLLGGLIGGSTPKKRSKGGLLGVVSGLFDKDKDGSAVDDILDMLTKK